MGIQFRRPAPSEATWRRHATDIRICQGQACLAAIKEMFGTDSQRKLELLVDGRSPYHSDEDRSISNKYRNWASGTVPSDDTIARAEAKAGGNQLLRYWRNQPLWKLLAKEPPDIEWLNRQMEAAPASVRRILFYRREPDAVGRFLHTPPTRTQALMMRDLHSLEAFVTHLCLARKAEVIADDLMHHLTAAAAYDMLPWVLQQHTPIRIEWKRLFRCLERVFWSREYAGGILFKFPMRRIASGLRILDEAPDAMLPQKLGVLGPGTKPLPTEC